MTDLGVLNQSVDENKTDLNLHPQIKSINSGVMALYCTNIAAMSRKSDDAWRKYGNDTPEGLKI